MMHTRQRRSAPHATEMSYPGNPWTTIPRYPDLPMEFDASLSSQYSQPDMENFSLLSLDQQVRPWYLQQYLSEDYELMPGQDDALSTTFSATGSLTLANITPPASVQENSTPKTDNSPPSSVAGFPDVNAVVQDFELGDESNPFAMLWATQAHMSPPPEQMLQLSTELPDEPTICEHLGVSKLQYSTKPRRSIPRPLRPSSERTRSQDDADSDSGSPPKDSPASARTDPMYDTKPDQTGHYHCPMKLELKCNHAPTKQKCIFAKNLDSHLRPYICRYAGSNVDCEDLRFSSNACLFRHEREAHGMHNHGHNPYLCDYKGCDRAKEGNGFPRKWNQRDHMKRVHGYEDNSNDGRRGDRKRRTKPGSVPMSRSGSSGYARGPHPYAREARPGMTTRYAADPLMYPPVPDFALTMPNMIEGDVFGPSFSEPVYWHPAPY